jgi:YD repeat-containing protein
MTNRTWWFKFTDPDGHRTWYTCHECGAYAENDTTLIEHHKSCSRLETIQPLIRPAVESRDNW